jgi:hypothetical protein
MTENIQHPTSDIQRSTGARFGHHWMFDVGCSVLDVPNFHNVIRASFPHCVIMLLSPCSGIYSEQK